MDRTDDPMLARKAREGLAREKGEPPVRVQQVVRRAWIPCEPPPGYNTHRGPYRAWKHTRIEGVRLVECPSYIYSWVDSGDWQLMRNGKTVARLGWYGRSRSTPPTTWANKQLKASAPNK